MADLLIAHLPGMILAWTAFFLASASPGPANMATIATSMTAGRPAGLAQAAGTVSTSFFWGILAAIGLGPLLEKYALAISILKLLGGLYLLWLAVKSFRAAARSPQLATPASAPANAKSLVAFFSRGVAIHITNPKPIFGWLATIALGVTQDSPAWIYAMIVMVGTLTSLAINLTYAMSFSSQSVTRFYNRFHHWFELTFGALFAAAGIKLLSDANHP